MIIETERIYLRKMEENDYIELVKMLQDDEVMYAYEGGFNASESKMWLEKQKERYKMEGIGLWAAILKTEGKMIGQCGLTNQKWKNKDVLEVGYMFNKEYWNKGYATETAKACKEYAFKKLKVEKVYAIIRDINKSSQKVAKNMDMQIVDKGVRHYRGIDMVHYLYSVSNNYNRK